MVKKKKMIRTNLLNLQANPKKTAENQNYWMPFNLLFQYQGRIRF